MDVRTVPSRGGVRRRTRRPWAAFRPCNPPGLCQTRRLLHHWAVGIDAMMWVGAPQDGWRRTRVAKAGKAASRLASDREGGSRRGFSGFVSRLVSSVAPRCRNAGHIVSGLLDRKGRGGRMAIRNTCSCRAYSACVHVRRRNLGLGGVRWRRPGTGRSGRHVLHDREWRGAVRKLRFLPHAERVIEFG